MPMPLTDTRIRAIKPSAKPQKIADGGALYLLVTPHGTKAWRLAYRYNGKQKTLSVGIYPVVTLGEARARRDRAKKLLADGIDPSAQRKLDRVTARAGENSFRAIAEELLEKHRIEGSRADHARQEPVAPGGRIRRVRTAADRTDHRGRATRCTAQIRGKGPV
jgi:Arm DNA-binding domain